MKRRYLNILASLGFAAFLLTSAPALAAVAPNLGLASTYSILAGTQVTNTGTSAVSGDVGISPASGAVGANHPGLTAGMVGGTIHDKDLAAQNAQAAENAAYTALDLANACTSTVSGTQELAGLSLVPGVYCATSFHLTNGTLTLVGTASDTWVFKSASDLIITGGVSAKVVSPSCSVWWRVVSTATFDAGSSLIGNILADTSITLAAGASLSGKALARTAEVTLSSNTISACAAPPAQLGLLKTVSGGAALPPAFTLTATGDPSTGPTVITGTTPVAPANAPVGVYTLTETGPAGYTAGYSCSGGGTLVGNKLTIGVADTGKTIICTIANTFTPAIATQLILQKTVSGGSALNTAFTLTATGDPSTGPTVVTGTTPVGPVNVPVGIYTLTETGPAGYTSTGFSCINGGTLVGNQLTIGAADAGKIITCTITNTFTPAIAAQLILQKTVSGGTALATAFTLTATGGPSTGPTVITGTTPVPAANVPVGVYTLTETGPAGYTFGFVCTGGGTLVGNQLTIAAADAGKTVICTIANTFIPARLGLVKTVNGGTASAGQFTLTASGPEVISGPAPVAPANAGIGVYTLTETGGPAGYTAGSFSCIGGGTLVGNQLTIGVADSGSTITCTITNTFTPLTPVPTLSEWGMIILAGLLALFGFVGVRRR